MPDPGRAALVTRAFEEFATGRFTKNEVLDAVVLRAWHERKAVVGRDAADADRNAKTIQQKLDRLDEAFIYAKAIDLDTYERQRDRLRQELTLTQIDRHSVELDKFDVEGILAFAERVLPRASDLWV